MHTVLIGLRKCYACVFFAFVSHGPTPLVTLYAINDHFKLYTLYAKILWRHCLGGQFGYCALQGQLRVEGDCSGHSGAGHFRNARCAL